MIVVDDDDEDEMEEKGVGNLVMAASFISPRDMGFMLKHGSGIVCWHERRAH